MENDTNKTPPGVIARSWAFAKEVYIKDWFDPHSSFLTLKSFWVPFLVIIALFIILCWKVIDQHNLELDLANWNVSDMYEWFKIPLWVFALLIPVLGLFNSNHKSEQTRETIRVTLEQNRTSNFFNRVNEFAKYCSELSHETDRFSFSLYGRILFNKLYPDAINGQFHLDKDYINSVKTMISFVVDWINRGEPEEYIPLTEHREIIFRVMTRPSNEFLKTIHEHLDPDSAAFPMFRDACLIHIFATLVANAALFDSRVDEEFITLIEELRITIFLANPLLDGVLPLIEIG